MRNIGADPAVRVRVCWQWRPARAHVVEKDDADARLASFGRHSHAAAVRRFGTDLTTVRFDLES